MKIIQKYMQRFLRSASTNFPKLLLGVILHPQFCIPNLDPANDGVARSMSMTPFSFSNNAMELRGIFLDFSGFGVIQLLLSAM